MIWDAEVDVVCTEAGLGGLASAIATVDGGGDVFVASSTRADGADLVPVGPRVDRAPHWLSIDVADEQTLEYFAALSCDIGQLNSRPDDVDVPISVVGESSSEGACDRVVEPFAGARLRNWAARCLASPYGWLYTRVSDRRTTTMRTRGGEAIEVNEVSTFEPGRLEGTGLTLADWLLAQVGERGIDVHPASPLQRIVFDGGRAVGAVFATPDGTFAVRARHGVSVAPGGPQVTTAIPSELLGGDGTARLCLVGRAASRFGRLELLTTDPVVPRDSFSCRSVNRHLHTSLHESKQLPSQTWRCGKVHGYPPLAQ